MQILYILLLLWLAYGFAQVLLGLGQILLGLALGAFGAFLYLLSYPVSGLEWLWKKTTGK